MAGKSTTISEDVDCSEPLLEEELSCEPSKLVKKSSNPIQNDLNLRIQRFNPYAGMSYKEEQRQCIPTAQKYSPKLKPRSFLG